MTASLPAPLAPGHALVTGGAGFIGSHLVDGLLADGWQVTVIDNFDPYYPESVKRRHIAAHLDHPRYRLVEADIREGAKLNSLLNDQYTVIVHLAAKAGVRNSLSDPLGYQMTNVIGTQNLLSFAHQRGIKPFVFGSSSSVYGNCPRLPWSESDLGLTPINPYASTKLANEQMGYVYAETFGLRFVGLRFFTVFGERQRPDLAIHKFARLMLKGQSIPVYGDGSSERDFTYWGDIVAGVRAAMAFASDKAQATYEVFNLGNNRTIGLLEMIRLMEKVLGVTAKIDWQDWQPGEMRRTWADISKSRALLGYEPATDFETGLRRFADWLAQQP
ncbi:NAD-dependent epimerase/dehydratase family protein [Nevskia sp.]|uniref:NAD-dependent epimerase/dehydratase family protein n=1 Tax=Nevskia sp. TaxID=1929292 RepID=UPI0025D79CF6|nr:NAD-dependent epimerase/dehydratase family protein [Nevskia sp.]